MFKKVGNTKNIDVKKYFLYRHIRLDKNEPFYIGMGINSKRTPRTRYYERAFKKDGRNKWWRRIVNKTKYEVDIIFETDNKDEIISKEVEFIKLYGRKDLGSGSLVNLTNGGEGIGEVSQEIREIISKRMLGNKHGYKPNKTVFQRVYFKGMPLPESHRLSLFGSHPNAKKIFCLTNGVTYNSIGECIRLLFRCNCLSKESEYRVIKNGISRVCNGVSSVYKKHKFIFV